MLVGLFFIYFFGLLLIAIWFSSVTCFILSSPPPTLTDSWFLSLGGHQVSSFTCSLTYSWRRLCQGLLSFGGRAVHPGLFALLWDSLLFLSVMDHLFPGPFCFVCNGSPWCPGSLKGLDLSGPPSSVSRGAGTTDVRALPC